MSCEGIIQLLLILKHFENPFPNEIIANIIKFMNDCLCDECRRRKRRKFMESIVEFASSVGNFNFSFDFFEPDD